LPLYLVLPRLDVANDRQLYLAIWPLGLALAAELLLLGSARIAGAALAALLLAAGVLTLQRNHDFRSELALWQQTVALSPDKSRVHNNLGYAYQLANQPLQARREFVQALQLDPDNFKARLNLRRLNLEQGSK
jgi:Flp pilus assembly protein TadD